MRISLIDQENTKSIKFLPRTKFFFITVFSILSVSSSLLYGQSMAKISHTLQNRDNEGSLSIQGTARKKLFNRKTNIQDTMKVRKIEIPNILLACKNFHCFLKNFSKSKWKYKTRLKKNVRKETTERINYQEKRCKRRHWLQVKWKWLGWECKLPFVSCHLPCTTIFLSIELPRNSAILVLLIWASNVVSN